MLEARPFRDVKLQWMQLLVCDPEINDAAKCIAMYIATTYLGGDSETAWPSYKTIADATGKGVKTVQRAVALLAKDDRWFTVIHGNGLRHSTRYTPSEKSVDRARKERSKGDNIVHLHPNKGGQSCPERVSNLSSKGGQICPPIEDKYINKNLNAREAKPNLFDRVSVNSRIERDLFLACEALQGRSVPLDRDGCWTFPSAVVQAARAALIGSSEPVSAHG